ncbi:MAG: CoA transferase [Gammaproteobacteria bacterium]|nr:CoA transferase [Gammaproteobacteria bacterium]
MCTQEQSPLPLTGVRVVDLSSVVMGPLATRMLADLGADVIWVESPEGDVLRHYEPMRNTKMGAFAMNVNRNKRSVVLDLKTETGQAALTDLLTTADVFVTNMRRGAITRLRIDEARVRAVSPDIIYCIANGFGSNGPYADRAAYDDVIQAASGLASTFMWNGGEPRLVPTVMADKVAGIHVAFAITAALYGREQTGKGVRLEVPMAETLAAFNLVEHLSGQTFIPQVGEFSYKRIRTPHRKPRRTSDGWIVILPYSFDNWRRFFEFGGRQDLVNDERFATAGGRVNNADELYAYCDDIVKTKSTDEWLVFCAEHSVPASAVVDLEKLGEDPHFAAVGLLQEDQHPTEGAYRYVRDPIKIDGQIHTVRQHAPRAGENTAEVFRELGWNDERIAALFETRRKDV